VEGRFHLTLARRSSNSIDIRDRPNSPPSPWQNGYSERLIGSIRRGCLEHVVVFGERRLRHLLDTGSDAPIAAQGRADPARRPDCRSDAADASSERTAPPIFQSVGFRQRQAVLAPQCLSVSAPPSALPRPDPKNEFGEPALGRHQDPWRVTQARHRGRSVHGLDLNGAAARSAIANLEDLRSQPYGGDCVD
jgi:hypothetical protein